MRRSCAGCGRWNGRGGSSSLEIACSTARIIPRRRGGSRETWREVFGDERATLVLGALADKDVPGICAALAPIAARAIAVPVRNPRRETAEKVCAALGQAAPGLDCAVAPDVARAIAAAGEYPERILVAGSLYLVAEALSYLTGRPLGEESLQ